MKTYTIFTLFILTLLLSSKTLHAQVKFGFKGGLNIADLTGRDVSRSVKSRVSFHAGVLTEIELAKMVGIQPEVLFSSQGYTLDEVTGVNSYLQLPVMGKFYPTKGFHIDFGPHLGFMLSAKEKQGTSSENAIDAFKTLDFGLSFGTGYKVESIGLIGGVRYNLGLVNVLKSNYNDTSIKNGVFQIYIGYVIM